MSFDKDQFKLGAELKSRLDWYWELQDKTFKQINLAPSHSIKTLMFKLTRYLEKVAIPTVQRLLKTSGQWSRDAAVEFYDANSEVCRLSELIQKELHRYYQNEM
ncbi:MAG: hypothetical protein ACTSWY_03835 [Promethearchaeota archaeon]